MIASEIAEDGDEKFRTHRFIWLDNEFQIKKLSHPFVFEGLKDELCSSLITNQYDDVLIGMEVLGKPMQIFGYGRTFVEQKLFDLPRYPKRVPDA